MKSRYRLLISILFGLTLAGGAWAGTGLTPKKLSGEWCYLALEHQYNPPEPMNRDYLFMEDGTFSAGREGKSRVSKGEYTIYDDGSIKLGLLPLKMKIEAVEANAVKLALPTGQLMVFKRGLCEE